MPGNMIKQERGNATLAPPSYCPGGVRTGASVSINNRGGERATEYLRASDPRPNVTEIAFPSATGRGQCVQSAGGMRVERQKMPPESVEIWVDTGQHFR